MASNIKVDIVKPTATNGSLSLKGDSGGSATANGITVDSSGNTSITGTFTSKGIDDNASSTALTIDASGNTTLAEKLIIDPAKGIQFRTSTGGSGTFGSGILDDYEEGTFTPSGNVITFSSASGSYTRIGRVIHVLGNVVWPITSNTNSAIIQGLPFNVSEQGAGHIGLNNIGGSEYYYLAFSGTDDIRFYNSSISNLNNASFSGKTVYFQVTYFV